MASSGSFLTRLRRDTRGNTIAIMAAAMIPMLGLAGSAVDMSRLYVVKVRLQQACDAGVLAGRKFMTGTGPDIDDTARDQAVKFFNNNYQNGWMKSSGTTFVPVKTSASQVSGTATTSVPMTIMAFFGFGNRPLSVTCQARYDVADTDVIFVLDTTGSMACLPSDSDADCTAYVNAAGNNSYTRPSGSNGVAGYAGATGFSVPEKNNSRIEALRKAVLSFYDTFDSVKDPSTRVRYGFVTYASSVNAGKAIKEVIPNSLVGSASGDTASYQSRKVYADYTISTNDVANNKAKPACDNFNTTRTPSAALTYDTGNGTAIRVSNVWDGNNSRCLTRTETLGPQWQYAQFAWDVTGVVAGNIVANPTKVRGQTMRWLGCVETTVDTPGQTSFSVTSPPSEINPDITPTGANRWIPQMQDLEYVRNVSWTNAATDYTNGDEGYYSRSLNKFVSYMYGSDAYATALNGSNRVSSDADYLQKSGAVACGKPVKRIGEMTRSEVDSWVHAADFAPIGGTYHDTGMIWGARLISPTGPWRGDTQPIAGRNVNRVIVFLTDGVMSPTTSSYGMYGLEGYEKRVVGNTFGGADPGSGKNTDGTCTDTNANCYKYLTLHNNRFLAACAAAKAHNIDIWTIAIDDASSTQLTQCATKASQAKYTTSGSDLTNIFADIAKNLAMLRLTQ